MWYLQASCGLLFTSLNHKYIPRQNDLGRHCATFTVTFTYNTKGLEFQGALDVEEKNSAYSRKSLLNTEVLAKICRRCIPHPSFV